MTEETKKLNAMERIMLRLSTIENQNTELQTRLERVEEENRELKRNLKSVCEKYSVLRKEFGRVRTENDGLKSSLKSVSKKYKNLKEKLVRTFDQRRFQRFQQFPKEDHSVFITMEMLKRDDRGQPPIRTNSDSKLVKDRKTKLRNENLKRSLSVGSIGRFRGGKSTTRTRKSKFRRKNSHSELKEVQVKGMRWRSTLNGMGDDVKRTKKHTEKLESDNVDSITTTEK